MKRGLKTILVTGALALLSVLFVAGFFILLNRPGSRTAEISGIVNSLRQIDAAKQQWAIDQKQQIGVPVTKDQLRDYLKPGSLKSNGVRYAIKPLGESDIAVLTRRFDGWIPEGTTVHLSTNSGYEFVFPNGTIRHPDGRVAIISNTPTTP